MTLTLTVPTWEKPSDSSDRKVQVTAWCEQKCTDHFWWDFLLFLLATGGRSVKPTSAVLLAAFLN